MKKKKGPKLPEHFEIGDLISYTQDWFFVQGRIINNYNLTLGIVLSVDWALERVTINNYKQPSVPFKAFTIVKKQPKLCRLLSFL